MENMGSNYLLELHTTSLLVPVGVEWGVINMSSSLYHASLLPTCIQDNDEIISLLFLIVDNYLVDIISLQTKHLKYKIISIIC